MDELVETSKLMYIYICHLRRILYLAFDTVDIILYLFDRFIYLFLGMLSYCAHATTGVCIRRDREGHQAVDGSSTMQTLRINLLPEAVCPGVEGGSAYPASCFFSAS